MSGNGGRGGGRVAVDLGGGGVIIEKALIRRALCSGWENKSHQAISITF